MINKVKNTINKYNMLSSGDRVGVAVSGGVDSIVMLDILFKLKEELGLELVVCHLNHNLRGSESDRDFDFVKEKAKSLGLTFEGTKLTESNSNGESTQSWARDKRYSFFDKTSSKDNLNKFCLGHNSNDRVETFLLRVIKGAGIDGLTGMKPVRGDFVRPLLEVSREEIEKYAVDNKINFVEDSSNKSTKYLRNLVRQELLPLLEEKYNPNIKETIARSIGLLELDSEFLNNCALREAQSIVKKDISAVKLDRKKLLELDKAIALRVILNSFFEYTGGVSLYSVHVESVFDLIVSPKPNTSIDLPCGFRVVREYDEIIITLLEEVAQEEFKKEVLVGSTTVVVETGDTFKAEVVDRSTVDTSSDPSVAVFDFEKVKSPLSVRNMKSGDRMRPFGMAGTKKLKDILIDCKIPKRGRAMMPVLESSVGVLWAVGVKRSDLFKVTADTKKVLKITYSR